MPLPRNHPALGAFLKKKLYRPDWQFIAAELANELQRRMEHNDLEGKCGCNGHLALRIYEDAIYRVNP